MFRFSRGFRGADFGTLGAQDGGGTTEKGGGAVEFTKEDTGGDQKKEGSFLSEVIPLAKSGIDLAQSAGLCGCANKDKQAQDNKQAELARKFPFRECGDPNQIGYNDCVKFNESQQRKQDAAFADWSAAQDADTSSKVSTQDKAKFAALNLMAKKLRAMHPEAGNMTIAQIREKYPDDFDKVYAEVQKAYPFLGAVDADNALAMAPGVADMKLDALIKKLDVMAAPAGMGVAQAGMGSLGGILAVGLGIGVLIFAAKKRASK